MVAQAQIESLHEQLELCYELIESRAIELQYNEQQLQETKQELMSTNQELCYALNSDPLPQYHEAKQTAKAILARNLSAKEAIAGLLSAIYNSPVKPEELQLSKSDTAKMPLRSPKADQSTVEFRELKTEFTKLKAQYIKMGAKSIEFKAHLMHRRELGMDQKQDQESQNHGKTPLDM